MPPLVLLIKPVSGACNMHCRYCFYTDVQANRAHASFGRMSLETLECLVQKAMAQADGSCTFAFQGGEPTLAGLDFYRALLRFQAQYGRSGLTVANTIQTNGLVIDREWAGFLAENHFLVGVSLDGGKDLHDINRLDAGRKGTFNRVMHAVQLLRQYQADFNILTVVTAQTARNIHKLYAFYKRNGLTYQQYIPCINPFENRPDMPADPAPAQDYALTPALYAEFLKNLFDLWYNDLLNNRYVYIRYFENLVGLAAGSPPESCGLLGQCTRQLVVEADGGVYPCDFYVLDSCLLGNLITDSFADIEQKRDQLGFIDVSRQVDGRCLSCAWRPLCRGGCRRDREPMTGGKLSLNRYCEAYQAFFPYVQPRLLQLAQWVSKNAR
ncbi:MAG: anaerobic sulfatase maturase [Clostridiaceae bacterium]|nr:anaerobic sulfatase maturase [Clostridiaceae bacterium]